MLGENGTLKHGKGGNILAYNEAACLIKSVHYTFTALQNFNIYCTHVHEEYVYFSLVSVGKGHHVDQCFITSLETVDRYF